MSSENRPRGTDIDALELAQDAGAVTHRLIAEIGRRHGGGATPEQVLDVAEGLGSARLAPVYRQSSRQRVATAAAAFFRIFGRPGWQLHKALTVVEGVEFDLLWRRQGRIVADELKTGLAAPELWFERVEQQVESQLEAGQAGFGVAFLGVRAVLLAEPEKSFYRGSQRWFSPTQP